MRHSNACRWVSECQRRRTRKLTSTTLKEVFKILKIPNSLLMPLIIVFSTVGVHAVDNSIFDVGMLFVFSIVEYFMKKFDLPPAPLVLSVVLGPLIERALRQSLTMSLGSYDIFITRPITVGLLLMAFAMVLWPDRVDSAKGTNRESRIIDYL
jgi:putative tricarboxylic transport membrane protein